MSHLHKIITQKSMKLLESFEKGYSEDNMRDISALLRFLFVEHINNTKNLIVTVLPSINSDNIEGLSYFQSGGAELNGLTVANMQVFNRALSSDEIKKLYNAQKGISSQKVKISNYLVQTAFVYEGIDIKKQDIIQFVANKLGGVHFDPKRKVNEIKYTLLDKIMNQYSIQSENPIYVELLAITQAICKSETFTNLIKSYESNNILS